MKDSSMLNIAVLLSGTGRTLQHFHNLIQQGKMFAQIVCVISDKINSSGADWALKHKLDVNYITLGGSSASPIVQSTRVFDLCMAKEVDLVCMAGWMTYLIIPTNFKNKVMNVHPSLLPSFGGKGMYGIRVHEAVLDYGCKWTGATVHFADDSYDTGPIIAQSVVRVEQTDTPNALAARVFQEECLIYPRCVQAFAQGRIHIDGRKIVLG